MSKYIYEKWNKFFRELPHHDLPYSKKNWGHPNHSLCSYQGKLKPAIAYHLVRTFVPRGGKVLDPFCGVGTIPFEAALAGKKAFGIDISPLAYYVSAAKTNCCSKEKCQDVISKLEDFIMSCTVPQDYIDDNGSFGFNKKLKDYYEPETFREILAARLYFQQNIPSSPEEMMVISSLLHILHGNRPYALSRRSHPIVPYAPTGDFIYKNLIGKVSEKVRKSLSEEYPENFKNSTIYLQDATLEWPGEINNLDAVITSPPFYDSTRFYVANWIRLWFTGWDDKTFGDEPQKYIDERQKNGFEVYEPIFRQSKERLKNGGYFVMHLGKSEKCDMGESLRRYAEKYFSHVQLYTEDVEHCAKFGIKDLGTVKNHEYLIME